MPSRPTLLIVMLALVVCVGTACGGAGSTTTAASSNESTTAPVTTPSTTAKGKADGGGKSSSTTKAGAQKKDGDPEFCTWVKGQRGLLIEDKSKPFPATYKDFLESTAKVRDHFPKDMLGDYDTIDAALQRIRPVMESGSITDLVTFTQWFAKNDPALYDKFFDALQRTGAYNKAHCA